MESVDEGRRTLLWNSKGIWREGGCIVLWCVLRELMDEWVDRSLDRRNGAGFCIYVRMDLRSGKGPLLFHAAHLLYIIKLIIGRSG